MNTMHSRSWSPSWEPRFCADILGSLMPQLKTMRPTCVVDQGSEKRQERHFHRGQTCQQRVRLPHDADRTKHRKRTATARRVITKTAPASPTLDDAGKNGTVCKAIPAEIHLD